MLEYIYDCVMLRLLWAQVIISSNQAAGLRHNSLMITIAQRTKAAKTNRIKHAKTLTVRVKYMYLQYLR